MKGESEYKLNSLPDLPGLESVEVSNKRSLALLAGVFALYAGMVGPGIIVMFALYRQYIPPQGVWLSVALAALGAWFIIRLAGADYVFGADRTGAFAKGFIRRRNVEWAEVQDARICRFLGSETSIRLETARGSLTIGSGLGQRDTDRLLAAAWQHVRRMGRADGVELTPGALTLWDIIPDELPREQEWANPPSRARWLPMLMMALLFIALPIALVIADSRWPMRVMMGAFTILAVCLFGFLLREWAMEATRVVLSDSEILARTSLRTVRIRWSDVDFAEWAQTGGLTIGSRKLRVFVSLTGSSTAGAFGMLILAIIRRLRTAGTPVSVVIPDTLRIATAGSLTGSATLPLDTGGKSEVMLKAGPFEKALGAICGSILLGMGPACIYELSHSLPLAVASVVLTMLLGLFATNCYYYRITPEVVAKRMFWYYRRVRWEQVADFEFSITRQHGYRKWILRDGEGRKLVDITIDQGARSDRQRFETCLSAHLTRIAPDTVRKPWLAQPWSSHREHGGNQ